MLAELTLGQVGDVCRQIREWVDAGEEGRARYWLARLRGEPLICTVRGCSSGPIEGRPWCHRHAPRMIGPPSPRRAAALRYAKHRAREAILRYPGLTIEALAERADCSPSTVRRELAVVRRAS